VFNIPKEQAQQLDELRSSVSFRWRMEPVPAGPGEDADRHGNKTWYNPNLNTHETVHEERCMAKLTDQIYGHCWATGYGDDEPEALTAALANAGADPSSKPKSPAELAAENQRLRQRLAENNGGSADEGGAATATATAEAGDSVNDDSDEGEQQAQATSGINLSDMSNSELAQAIQAREGHPPGGDKRTSSWREEAEAELKRLIE